MNLLRISVIKMKFKLTQIGLIVLLFLVAVIIYAFSRCKVRCSAFGSPFRDNYAAPRGASDYALKDNTYGYRQLPSFVRKWNYNIPQYGESDDESDREDYTATYDCDQKCRTIAGNTPYHVCMDKCITNDAFSSESDYHPTPCDSHDDCGNTEICVRGGAYSGSPDSGFCMSDNEPGMEEIRASHMAMSASHIPNAKENFAHAESCTPSMFFNEVAGKCQPRFQGVASAWGGMLNPPTPPPKVSIPGPTRFGYGVGINDPLAQMTNVQIQD